jgi:1,4-dihydroxy-2-naphthoate octaprenyltransferase
MTHQRKRVSLSSSTKPDTSSHEKKGLDAKPPKLKVWVLAARPHTLTASVSPVLVGASLVHHYQKHNSNVSLSPYSVSLVTLTFMAFAGLIQLGTNLHNDYADFVKGADTHERVGQARATQKGWLTPFETNAGASFCLVLASLLGVSLMVQTGRYQDPYLIFMIVSSVFNAVCYTGGPYPLGYIGLGHLSIGYSGLGDLFVFLYFGLVATCTVPYCFICQILDNTSSLSTWDVFHHELFITSLIVALPVSFLATAIIVVNNLRDRHTDVKVGKNTLAVRFGETFARNEYRALVQGSYIMLVPIAWRFKYLYGSTEALWIYFPLLSILRAKSELKALSWKGKDGAALNEHVGGTARLQFMFCIMLVIALRNC